jgi:hypothetical protein
MIVSICSLRKLLVFAAVTALALAGCGGDDEDKSSTSAPTTEQTAEQTTETETPTSDVNPETETLPNDGDGTGTGGGENQQGGAGDEQPAETLALFTAENGKITPAVVRVPAFISVRVELRSADGKEYGLTFEGETIKVHGGLGSVSTTLDGLRPGTKLVGTPTGASGKVRIEATAEPGP